MQVRNLRSLKEHWMHGHSYGAKFLAQFTEYMSPIIAVVLQQTNLSVCRIPVLAVLAIGDSLVSI